MPPPITIKICGLSTPETLAAALDAGADLVAFNFHPKSPRYVPPDRARALAPMARGRAKIVALMVDRPDGEALALAEAASADLLQLHGAARLDGEPPAETPRRIAELGKLAGRPVMKAVGVAASADLSVVPSYAEAGARILLDAKPPADAAYPGGHGRTFDWSVLAGLDPRQPFMLSGGLTPDNVGEAIRAIRAMGLALAGVDVSSGVESAPGVKDPAKIAAFIAAARSAAGDPT